MSQCITQSHSVTCEHCGSHLNSLIFKTPVVGKKNLNNTCSYFCVLKTRARQSFKACSRAFTVQNTEILTLGNHSNDSTRTTFRPSQIKDISKLRPWGSFLEYLKYQHRPPPSPIDRFQNVNKSPINLWKIQTVFTKKNNSCPKSMYGNYENTYRV